MTSGWKTRPLTERSVTRAAAILTEERRTAEPGEEKSPPSGLLSTPAPSSSALVAVEVPVHFRQHRPVAAVHHLATVR
jgi:hypothetical protein